MKEVQPATIATTNFYSEGARARIEGSSRDRRKTTDTPSVSEADERQFLQLMCTISDTLPVMMHMFSETCSNFKPTPMPPKLELPSPLRDLYQVEHNELLPFELSLLAKDVREDLVVTIPQIDRVKTVTKSQSQCLEWYKQRAGRITASTAHGVLHTKLDSPAKSVILKITSDSSKQLKTPAIEHGRKFECVTFDDLSSCLPLTHTNATLNKVGMHISLEQPWLAASADGQVSCQCHGTGVLEIKCPYNFRNSTACEMLSDQTRCCLDSAGALKERHPYYTQVQMQMHIYDVSFCIFVVRAGDELCIDTVQRNSAFLEDAVPKLEHFWEQNIATELLTRRLEDQNKFSTPTVVPAAKLYCYCQEPEDIDDSPGAQFVGCDGVNCPYEWVHLRCIRPKRKTVPKGVWYCRHCKKSKCK